MTPTRDHGRSRDEGIIGHRLSEKQGRCASRPTTMGAAAGRGSRPLVALRRADHRIATRLSRRSSRGDSDVVQGVCRPASRRCRRNFRAEESRPLRRAAHRVCICGWEFCRL